ncbi:hypothetical protein [Nocardioides sp. YIM 152588]|uniref:hypothetical protein n=1 Tax=Nocardioides sp. YIM 152588 TaxID=3158259 RepID=UPI0032E388DB
MEHPSSTERPGGRRGHRPRALPALLALLLAATLMAALGATAPTSSARGSASLSISKKNFYGGQGLTFRGNIGRTAATRIWLEFHMGLAGDSWTPVEDSERTTAADGSFSFVFPARSMYNIRLRVAASSGATPAVTLVARDQAADVKVTAPGHDLSLDGYRDHTSYPVVAGEPMRIRVDTSPDGEPVLAGRTVELQRRVRSTRWTTRWKTIGTDSVGGKGFATFERSAPQHAGTVTYRARLDDWRRGGSRIGWFPSFPVEVDVLGAEEARASELAARARPTPVVRRSTITDRTVALRDDPWHSSAGTTASLTHAWAPANWDFAFEYGESLSDKPFRGTDRRGSWTEYSTGSGRAAKENGGLQLESKFSPFPRPANAGDGDHGTTAVTLKGNPRTYGRWEVRIRPWTAAAPRDERGGNYRVRAELVPAKPRLRACGARSIVIADMTPYKSKVRFGAATPKGRQAWTGTRRNIKVYGMPRAYAVEVAADHISWFIDGRVVGTLKNTDAIPDVPLTLRISLVGKGQKEMDHTYAIMDWMRGFDLARGNQIRKGAPLKATRNTASC